LLNKKEILLIGMYRDGRATTTTTTTTAMKQSF